MFHPKEPQVSPIHLVEPRQPETRIAVLAARIVSLAEALQLVPRTEEDRTGHAAIKAALAAFAREGVARNAASLVEHLHPEALADVLSNVVAAVEECPLPQLEWPYLAELLGEHLLGKIVGVSASSFHRYRAGGRPTPDHIAARLHIVTLIVADLSGSYNDFGIRRWFGRKRSALSGQSPVEVLSGNWAAHDQGTEQVRALAASLLAPFAA